MLINSCKNIFINSLLFILIFTNYSCSQNEPDQLNNNLDIKTETQWVLEKTDNKITLAEFKQRMTRYNQKGMIIEVKVFNNKGQIEELIKYNDFNDVVEKSGIAHERQSDETSPYKLSYSYEYDSLNQKIKMSNYDENNKLSGYTLYAYDSKGNCTKIIDYKNNNIMNSHTVFSFDDVSRILEKIDYYSSKRDNYREQINFESDKNNCLTKIIFNSNDGWSYEINYKYNENCLLI